MSKTTNYQLTLWDYADEDFSPGRAREDLAANFTKLDTALKAEATARQSAVNTLNAALAGKAAIVTGSYTGNGDDTRTISLGFTPKAVFLIGAEADIKEGRYTCGGIALNGQEGWAVTVVNGGFSVRYYVENNFVLCTNRDRDVYCYWALR